MKGMWLQTTDPMHNLLLSASFAVLPIIFLFVLLLSRKVGGHVAALLTLGIGLIVSVTAFAMPAELAGTAALYGIIDGLFPIGWIVLNAVFLYNMSVQNGGFAIVRDSIESITSDRRIQALLIAFCFGAFLEGAAGFGAPVAITAGMLVGLGFEAFYAAGICLIANTAPVAFGGLGIAVVTAGHLANIDPNVISVMIAHQLPFMALIIPLWLVIIIAGWKGAREVWPAIAVTGISYAITMLLAASYLGPALPDVLSAIVSIGSLIVLLRYWQPARVWRFPGEKAVQTDIARPVHARRELVRAWTPFILLIIFVSNWGNPVIQSILNKVTFTIPFGPLAHGILTQTGPLSVSYSFNWLGAAGTAILFAALLSSILLRISAITVVRTWWQTLVELRKALITIGSIVGFAFVANYSGMSVAIGNALTLTGSTFAFISPILGWFGVFITGSDTSSNALFSSIQSHTAESIGMSPVLSVAANSSGGVAAKMISPQSVAVATAASGLVGQEGKLFRFTILHSVGLVTIICVLTFLQAHYATWMVPQTAIETVAGPQTFGPGSICIAFVSICIILALAFVGRRESPMEATS